jgi:hypothetical protein
MAKKKVAEKKRAKTNHPKVTKNVSVDKILVENFVSLQKVMTNLASKFDNLSTQISKLLELFEISAKSLAEKGYTEKGDNKKVVDRLDSLLEQNKVIARGLALLHEKEMPEEKEVVIMPQKIPQPTQPAPLARRQIQPQKPNVPRMPPRQMQRMPMAGKPSEEFSKIRYTKE